MELLKLEYDRKYAELQRYYTKMSEHLLLENRKLKAKIRDLQRQVDDLDKKEDCFIHSISGHGEQDFALEKKQSHPISVKNARRPVCNLTNILEEIELDTKQRRCQVEPTTEPTECPASPITERVDERPCILLKDCLPSVLTNSASPPSERKSIERPTRTLRPRNRDWKWVEPSLRSKLRRQSETLHFDPFAVNYYGRQPMARN